MPNTTSNSRAINNTHYAIEALSRFDGGGWHYSTISTPAVRMSPNREANADAYATVKPRIAFVPVCNQSRGEHIAAGGELERQPCSREPIAGGEIGKTVKCEIVRSGGLQDNVRRVGDHAPSNDRKSGNIRKHREVSQKNTWNGSREAADESRMSGERLERGMTAFSEITANLARTEADEVRFYFIETTKGDQQMKTKLDTMNHRQRAAFARSLYHRPSLPRTAVTAASAYGIRRAK